MNLRYKCTQATFSNIYTYSTHATFTARQIPKCNVNPNIGTNSISCVLITLAYIYNVSNIVVVTEYAYIIL